MREYIGYDAQSMGLLKRGHTNTDEKYIAISNVGGITEYALHPRYFTPEGTTHLLEAFKDKKPHPIQTDVYVNSIDLRGFVNHGDYFTHSMQTCPVIITNNHLNGRNPYDYAQELENGTADRFGMFYLTYGATIEPFELNIKDLQDIDLNADGAISISVPGFSQSFDLQHVLNSAALTDQEPIITIAPGDVESNGFHFQGHAFGTDFTGIYTSPFIQSATVTGYTQHMLQNAAREAAFEQSNLYNSATGVFSSISGANGFSLAGGINSVLGAFLAYGLREAGFDDMKNQHNHLGGTVIENPVGESLENLLSISYPIAKQINTGLTSNGVIKPGDYATGNLKSFQINKRFASMQAALDFIEQEYTVGELVKIDAEPVISYGNYTDKFKRVLSLGGI